MNLDAPELVLGRGSLFFSEFQPETKIGIGETYIGHTPNFSFSRSLERVERYTSYSGLRIEQDGEVVSEGADINFTTDHIDVENIRRWLGSTTSVKSQAQAVNATESLTLYRGRFYQLGVTAGRPTGYRFLTRPTITRGASTIAFDANFEFDNLRGRLFVKRNAPNVTDGLAYVATYSVPETSQPSFASEAREIKGALRFVADNARGENTDYFFPFVSISPVGDYNLKGDEWQSIRFVAEVRRLNPLTKLIYAERNEFEGYESEDERYLLLEEGLLSSEFVTIDDFLDVVVNTTIPDNDYGRSIFFELDAVYLLGAGGVALADFQPSGEDLHDSVNYVIPGLG